MGGRLQDGWQFMWHEIWLRLEEVDDCPADLYKDLYVELEKAYRKAPARNEFDTVANDPVLARTALQLATAENLRGENSIAHFLEDAYDVLVETGHPELPHVYEELVASFWNREIFAMSSQTISDKAAPSWSLFGAHF